MVMWYWSADTLFWQLSIDHSMDIQYQKSPCLLWTMTCHVGKLRRRANAPTSNTANHDNHEKIKSRVSFSFPWWVGAPLGGPWGRRSSALIAVHITAHTDSTALPQDNNAVLIRNFLGSMQRLVHEVSAPLWNYLTPILEWNSSFWILNLFFRAVATVNWNKRAVSSGQNGFLLFFLKVLMSITFE